MNRTVFHITKHTILQNLTNQSEKLFPFLNSDLVGLYAKQQIKFKRIHALVNHKNIQTVIPEANHALTMKQDKKSYEFAFFGRSNVGKSSLLNVLMQRSTALTSKQPGKTKQLLFCELSTAQKAYFVDAPGYGFATGVAKSELNQWGKLVQKYLKRERNSFITILCLIDITHDLKTTDALIFEMLNKLKRNFQIVFTKCDKMSQEDIKKGLEIALIIQKKYQWMSFYIHFTSSKTNQGIEELRNHIMFTVVNQQI